MTREGGSGARREIGVPFNGGEVSMVSNCVIVFDKPAFVNATS